MITAKEAVAAAAAYMKDIYGNPEGLLVEEIEQDSANRVWRVTMGFWLALPPRRPSGLNALAEMMEPIRVKRTFKALEVSMDSGEVMSMKIRQLPE